MTISSVSAVEVDTGTVIGTGVLVGPDPDPA